MNPRYTRPFYLSSLFVGHYTSEVSFSLSGTLPGMFLENPPEERGNPDQCDSEENQETRFV